MLNREAACESGPHTLMRCLLTGLALAWPDWFSVSRAVSLPCSGRSGHLWLPRSCSLGAVLSLPGVVFSSLRSHTFRNGQSDLCRGREPRRKGECSGSHPSLCSSECYKACLPRLILASIMRMLVKLEPFRP